MPKPIMENFREFKITFLKIYLLVYACKENSFQTWVLTTEKDGLYESPHTVLENDSEKGASNLNWWKILKKFDNFFFFFF